MTYATAMVVIELGRSNARLLAFAADLATRMGLGLVGVAACQPMAAIYDQSMVLGDYVQEDRDELDAEIKAAKVEFDTALDGRGIELDWHSTVTISSLCEYTVARARAADIILCATGGEPMVVSRRASVSDIVMHAGRPVLLVPTHVEKLSLDHAVIAWKDTREARRAIADALPLLKLARKVTIIEIATAAELSTATMRLNDIVDWLRHHRITATATPTLGIGDDATQLARCIADANADLTVAGAYGHSRLRQWALGGVTRDLLLAPPQCALLSH
jgi:nucleotide-binding universal stress UspA family protein